jgi:hypothetical protein
MEDEIMPGDEYMEETLSEYPEELSESGMKGGAIEGTTTEAGDINAADLEETKKEVRRCPHGGTPEDEIPDVASVLYGERTAGEPNEEPENWGD